MYASACLQSNNMTFLLFCNAKFCSIIIPDWLAYQYKVIVGSQNDL
jgi:hypothetical protein